MFGVSATIYCVGGFEKAPSGFSGVYNCVGTKVTGGGGWTEEDGADGVAVLGLVHPIMIFFMKLLMFQKLIK